MTADITYDRKVLVEILVYHYRVFSNDRGCGCGWNDLGASWPEHIAAVYEESMRVRQS